ncbi:hypothetical protein MY04_4955 [Flammeovirga sp. MY04]|uniref:leucine-rich repeat domain-containing protein n=1 Tax=Flammeovirga sp. MY04 TaxID=1191459 RepID=UPI000806399F|nr:hypothetical protein [Flammeovirga sp. MY04]ANQ52290.1 hypothetical protein MY04_4955 [Flammeovirga sp. MY04]
MKEEKALDLLEKKYGDTYNYSIDKNGFVSKIIIENNKTLTEFPKELKAFKYLRRIVLMGCNISEIPEFVTQFDSLEEIAVGSNPIDELPEFISRIKTLKAININSTNISEIPNSFSKLPIEGIFLKNSKIEGIPEICYQWKNTLNSIYLNDLNELPSNIKEFKKLERLRVSLNSFKYLDTIENLRFLFLNNSSAKYLPENFGNLEKLESIEFRNCKNLVKIPNSIGKIEKLWGLMLTNCERLTALPKGLQNVNIGVLELTGCHQLKTVPKGLQAGTIRAENTNWKSMPSGIFSSGANTLWVTGHQITDITGIGNMYNLEFCNLSNGKIQKIPDDIGRLKVLISLNVEHNQIKYLPPALKNCPNLTSVRTFGNPVFDMSKIDVLN